MKKGGVWELAPAYDVCFAYSPSSIWVNQHALSINGKRKDFARKDLLDFAASINVKKADKIIQEIKVVVEKWEYFAGKVNVSDRLTQKISVILNENLANF